MTTDLTTKEIAALDCHEDCSPDEVVTEGKANLVLRSRLFHAESP